MIGTVEAAVEQMREQRMWYLATLKEVYSELLGDGLYEAAARLRYRIEQSERQHQTRPRPSGESPASIAQRARREREREMSSSPQEEAGA